MMILLNKQIREHLREKVEEADMALALKSYSQDRVQWADAHVDYALALAALGDEEEAPLAFHYYQNAINALENALKVHKKTGDLSLWSATNISLSQILRVYGHRQGGDIGVLRLERARDLMRQVLDGLKGKELLLEEALAGLEYAYIYQALAACDQEERRALHLEQAIFAFQNAKNLFRIKEHFAFWAGTLFVLGAALREYAKLQPEQQACFHIRQALENFETAASYFQDMGRLSDYLQVLTEIGASYLLLAHYLEEEEAFHSLCSGRECFEQIRSALKNSEKYSVQSLVKLNSDIADILCLIADLPEAGDADSYYERAVELYKESISVVEKTGDKLNLALLKSQLAKIYSFYAYHDSADPGRFVAKMTLALPLWREALDDKLRKTRFAQWLAINLELACSCHYLARAVRDDLAIAYYKEAIERYEEIRGLFVKSEEPVFWSKLQNWQALAYEGSAQIYRQDPQYLAEYKKALEMAHKHYGEMLSAVKNPQDGEYFAIHWQICKILQQLAKLHHKQAQEKEYLAQARQLSAQLVAIMAGTALHSASKMRVRAGRKLRQNRLKPELSIAQPAVQKTSHRTLPVNQLRELLRLGSRVELPAIFSHDGSVDNVAYKRNLYRLAIELDLAYFNCDDVVALEADLQEILEKFELLDAALLEQMQLHERSLAVLMPSYIMLTEIHLAFLAHKKLSLLAEKSVFEGSLGASFAAISARGAAAPLASLRAGRAVAASTVRARSAAARSAAARSRGAGVMAIRSAGASSKGESSKGESSEGASSEGASSIAAPLPALALRGDKKRAKFDSIILYFHNKIKHYLAMLERHRALGDEEFDADIDKLKSIYQELCNKEKAKSWTGMAAIKFKAWQNGFMKFFR